MADRSVKVRLEAVTHNFDRNITKSSVLTADFARELEAADGRMANIVQTGLALAPALVPLGAAGIPAIAGLTTQLGFAALGTGALVLGLNGVGDALTALDNYQLDPTTEHFKKLQTSMEKLGPAGGEFVLFLDQVEPRLKRLRNLAEAGLLPGFEDGLRNVLKLMPELRQVVFTTSTTLGDLIKNAGNNLDDPRWHEFFGFLETRARPTLTEMGQTAGNFAAAFANLVMDFDPLERDFSKGLLHMSVVVKDWSDGLEQSTGFQDLVDYVRTNGPRALDTLQALGGALTQIVEAAAPVGAIALPIVTDLLKVVGAIADAPLVGSGLVGLAAAIGIYGRSLALLETVGLRGSREGILATTVGKSRGRIREATAALTEVTTAQDRARMSATELAAAEERRATSVRRGLSTMSKGAAVAAGFAVAQTGVADSLGLSNTASLALIGTIGGPWGAAAGAAVGFTMDLAHANDDLENSIKQVNRAADNLDFSTMRAGIADMLSQLNDAKHTTGPGDFISDTVKNIAFGISHPGPFAFSTGRRDNTKDAHDAATQQLNTLRANATALFAVLHDADPAGLKLTDAELEHFTSDVAPAMQRAGLDVAQVLQNGPLLDPIGWMRTVFAVHEWVTAMDSAQGRSAAVGQALVDLQSHAEPTVDAVKSLSDALDALFSPALDESAALDRWIIGLQQLRDELGKTGPAISGNSVEAANNRELIKGSVENLLNRVKTTSGDKVVPTLLAGRQAIIDTAVAAGKSRTEVEKYLNTLGLAPRNLTTIISTPGLLTAHQKVAALATLYGKTPKEVRTLIAQLNMDHSQSAIKELAHRYGLTPKEVRTVLEVIGADESLGKINTISAAMRKLKDKTVTIKVRNVYEATHSNALGSISPGDVANRHMPELAGPGVTRVWREPETQGEAYIPLANDYRRPRAVDIWERTGMALGVQFRRFALGGMDGGSVAGGDLDLSKATIQQLARAMLAARPLIAQQTVMPHNYSEFRRQQEQIERAVGIGGVPG